MKVMIYLKGWDGYFEDGKLAVQGVYVWKVKGRYADGDYLICR